MTLDPAALEKAKYSFRYAPIPKVSAVPKDEAKRLKDEGLSSSWETWVMDIRMRSALKAYITELSKTHAIVPREMDRKMLAAADRAQGHLSKYGIKVLWNALIAEIDGRNGK